MVFKMATLFLFSSLSFKMPTELFLALCDYKFPLFVLTKMCIPTYFLQMFLIPLFNFSAKYDLGLADKYSVRLL